MHAMRMENDFGAFPRKWGVWERLFIEYFLHCHSSSSSSNSSSCSSRALVVVLVLVVVVIVVVVVVHVVSHGRILVSLFKV